MSECRTCSFAAYDGTCLAKGKLTVLDAPACELNRSTAAAQIAELKCENAELRRELEQWHKLTENIELPEYPTCEFQPKELERENAKLRELVRAARKCVHSGLSCSDCRLVAGGCTLESAMRELGVEVEG